MGDIDRSQVVNEAYMHLAILIDSLLLSTLLIDRFIEGGDPEGRRIGAFCLSISTPKHSFTYTIVGVFSSSVAFYFTHSSS